MERIAVIDGVRTPFVKPLKEFAGMSALDLGTSVAAELLHRTGVDEGQVGQVVFGQVIQTPDKPNIAREVGLRCGLAPTVDAYSVSRACATSYQSMVSAAMALREGDWDLALCGGADSASDAPLELDPELSHHIKELQGDLTWTERVQILARMRPSHLVPKTPSASEPSTGLTMGESAEKMAKKNGISRTEQDDFARRSHVRASQAWESGDFDAQVMAVHARPDFERTVTRDGTLRPESSLEDYAELSPVFDPNHGTLTAANSSPLSDGAAALLLARESMAEKMGLEPLGYLKAHAFSAVDPQDELLIGPARAIPAVLEKAGLDASQLDAVDLHEAFAAQVLSVLNVLRRDAGIEFSPERLNVHGGSIALGHPFAATGARQIMQLLHILEIVDGKVGLCSACAAGGLSAALVLERS